MDMDKKLSRSNLINTFSSAIMVVMARLEKLKGFYGRNYNVEFALAGDVAKRFLLKSFLSAE